jgi:hypothetical protein
VLYVRGDWREISGSLPLIGDHSVQIGKEETMNGSSVEEFQTSPSAGKGLQVRLSPPDIKM